MDGLMMPGAKSLVNLTDRMRHGRRHAAIRQKLASMPRPRKVLIVCYGNVCRSPYLEAALRSRAPDIHVASTGFTGTGLTVPPHALAVAARKGLDLSSFRSTTIQPWRARTADVVIVMDEAQARYLASYVGVHPKRILIAGDLDPEKPSSRTIQDPYQQSIEEFETCFARLDRCAATLAESLLPPNPIQTIDDTAEPPRVPRPARKAPDVSSHLPPSYDSSADRIR
jgi:protein-tyrosine phosphatase